MTNAAERKHKSVNISTERSEAQSMICTLVLVTSKYTDWSVSLAYYQGTLLIAVTILLTVSSKMLSFVPIPICIAA